MNCMENNYSLSKPMEGWNTPDKQQFIPVFLFEISTPYQYNCHGYFIFIKRSASAFPFLKFQIIRSHQEGATPTTEYTP